jgi:hypothetical protein
VEPGDLYGLPLEQFTAARNALAKTHPEVQGLRKPSAAAFAVNQLARRHADELDAFLGAAAQLRHAQLKGGDVRGATQEERQALQRLLQLAGEYTGSTQIDRVRQTLQAAAVDEQAAERVRAGRLERELEPGGFGSLVSGPAPAARREPAPPKRDRKAERAAVEEARRQVQAARRAAHEAEEALEQAEEAAARAHERLEAAEAELEEAERRAAS